MYLHILPHPHIFVIHVGGVTSHLFPPVNAGEIAQLSGHLAVNLTKIAGVHYGKDRLALKKEDYQRLMSLTGEEEEKFSLSYRREIPPDERTKSIEGRSFLMVNCHYLSLVDDTEARGRQSVIFFEGAKGLYLVMRHRLETLLGLGLTPHTQE
jgi:hypothetical protein